ncbi:unnamed protein product [Notodromas monacha]|uniref:PKD domain-containing protein n=1 Tax=Notodromas monacha TaxID=399045 RepID=A0A7R9BM88_9CRUS|nr:unnamed protein product [Notodromas monacha]CAG0917806.1 unnamed protein product [Notodromas monacha]
MDDFDIYENIITPGENESQLIAREQFEQVCAERDLAKQETEKWKQECENFSRNIKSLLTTAREESRRKDALLRDLQNKYDTLLFRRGFGPPSLHTEVRRNCEPGSSTQSHAEVKRQYADTRRETVNEFDAVKISHRPSLPSLPEKQSSVDIIKQEEKETSESPENHVLTTEGSPCTKNVTPNRERKPKVSTADRLSSSVCKNELTPTMLRETSVRSNEIQNAATPTCKKKEDTIVNAITPRDLTRTVYENASPVNPPCSSSALRNQAILEKLNSASKRMVNVRKERAELNTSTSFPLDEILSNQEKLISTSSSKRKSAITQNDSWDTVDNVGNLGTALEIEMSEGEIERESCDSSPEIPKKCRMTTDSHKRLRSTREDRRANFQLRDARETSPNDERLEKNKSFLNDRSKPVFGHPRNRHFKDNKDPYRKIDCRRQSRNQYRPNVLHEEFRHPSSDQSELPSVHARKSRAAKQENHSKMPQTESRPQLKISHQHALRSREKKPNNDLKISPRIQASKCEHETEQTSGMKSEIKKSPKKRRRQEPRSRGVARRSRSKVQNVTGEFSDTDSLFEVHPSLLEPPSPFPLDKRASLPEASCSIGSRRSVSPEACPIPDVNEVKLSTRKSADAKSCSLSSPVQDEFAARENIPPKSDVSNSSLRTSFEGSLQANAATGIEKSVSDTEKRVSVQDSVRQTLAPVVNDSKLTENSICAISSEESGKDLSERAFKKGRGGLENVSERGRVPVIRPEPFGSDRQLLDTQDKTSEVRVHVRESIPEISLGVSQKVAKLSANVEDPRQDILNTTSHVDKNDSSSSLRTLRVVKNGEDASFAFSAEVEVGKRKSSERTITGSKRKETTSAAQKDGNVSCAKNLFCSSTTTKDILNKSSGSKSTERHKSSDLNSGEVGIGITAMTMGDSAPISAPVRVDINKAVDRSTEKPQEGLSGSRRSRKRSRRSLNLSSSAVMVIGISSDEPLVSSLIYLQFSILMCFYFLEVQVLHVRMKTRISVSALLLFLVVRKTAAATLFMSSNSPTVKGSQCGFSAKIDDPKHSDGQAYTYSWSDDYRESHSLVETKTDLSSSVTFDYQKPGVYKMFLKVTTTTFKIFPVEIASGSIEFQVTEYLNGRVVAIQNGTELTKDSVSNLYLGSSKVPTTFVVQLHDPYDLIGKASMTSFLWDVNDVVQNTTVNGNYTQNLTSIGQVKLRVTVTAYFNQPTTTTSTTTSTTTIATTTAPTTTTPKTDTNATTVPPKNFTSALAARSKRGILQSVESLLVPSKQRAEFDDSRPFFLQGVFETDVDISDPIDALNITGNTWLPRGTLLRLNVSCAGTGPWKRCWLPKTGSYNVTNKETCLMPVTQYVCDFGVVHYFPTHGVYTMVLVMENSVSKIVKAIAVNVYDVASEPQLSTIIVPVLCSVLAMVFVIFGVAYYFQNRSQFLVETADFDFQSDGTNDDEVVPSTFWERVCGEFKALYLSPPDEDMIRPSTFGRRGRNPVSDYGSLAT